MALLPSVLPVLRSVGTPASGKAFAWIDSLTRKLKIKLADGTITTIDPSAGPTGSAGGDLSGTYPNPSVATVGGTAAATVAAQLPSSGEKAALAGTSGPPGSGNKYVTDGDSRLTNSRAPTGSASGDLSGSYPNPTVAKVAGVTPGAGGLALLDDADAPTSRATLLLPRAQDVPRGATQFTTARTVAGASPEYGWTWLNRTALSSANENTTTANAVHGAHGSTSTDWTEAGVHTAPTRYYLIEYLGAPLEIVGLFYSNGAANYEQCGMLVFDSANLNSYVKCGVGWSATRGGISVEARIGAGSLISVAASSGQRNAGVWVRMVLVDDQVYVHYNLTASGSPPTTWTMLTSGTFVRGKTLGIGHLWQTVNTSGALTGGCKWWEWSTAALGYQAIPSFQATQ